MAFFCHTASPPARIYLADLFYELSITHLPPVATWRLLPFHSTALSLFECKLGGRYLVGYAHHMFVFAVIDLVHSQILFPVIWPSPVLIPKLLTPSLVSQHILCIVILNEKGEFNHLTFCDNMQGYIGDHVNDTIHRAILPSEPTFRVPSPTFAPLYCSCMKNIRCLGTCSLGTP